MIIRFFAAASLAVFIAVPGPAAEKASPRKSWTAPRTADGQPDLQGVWSFATLTPLERPPELAGKQVFSDQEALEYEKVTRERRDPDRRDGTKEADVGRAYNASWWDFGTRIVGSRRTSLIVDPPDGKVPALTPDGQQRADARATARRLHPADGPEDRSLPERCIQWGTAGPPMVPSAYNNNFQLFQSRNYVVILNEMIHDARVIPLDGRPHLPQGIRQLLGDSRGRWDGATLVVDTTNFTDKTNFRGAGPDLHLIERFTRVAPDTLLYEFTVDDPKSFTKPWSAAIPTVRNDDLIYEYACHEGNYGMFGILKGARVEEEAAAKKESGK
jgi:hypothetical protein